VHYRDREPIVNLSLAVELTHRVDVANLALAGFAFATAMSIAFPISELIERWVRDGWDRFKAWRKG
jgi:hypothetical protein